MWRRAVVDEIFPVLHVGATREQVRVQRGLFADLDCAFQLGALVDVVERSQRESDVIGKEIGEDVGCYGDWVVTQFTCIAWAESRQFDIGPAVGPPNCQRLTEILVAGGHAQMLGRIPEPEDADSGVDEKATRSL